MSEKVTKIWKERTKHLWILFFNCSFFLLLCPLLQSEKKETVNEIIHHFNWGLICWPVQLHLKQQVPILTTQQKRHQNPITISCQWILKIPLLWHSCRTVILRSYVNSQCRSINPNKSCNSKINAVILQSGRIPTSLTTSNLSSTKMLLQRKQSCMERWTSKIKHKKIQENKISSVKLASERLINSSVLCIFLSYSLVSLLSFLWLR